jgi:hypothetical protein
LKRNFLRRFARDLSGIIACLKSKTQMALISQISQMGSVRAAQPICAICGISAIFVGFWKSRDAWPSTGTIRDSSTPRFALRSE